MSMKTYLEAVDAVLSAELEKSYELIVFRPGARRALEESERDVAIPRMGRAAFSMALGAAMTGMHPVLDLRQESDGAGMLVDAVCNLPAGRLPEMTVITDSQDADVLADIPGVLLLKPVSPRQAAGFTRAALRNTRLSVVLLDRALYEEEDEIPEDGDFMMLPLDDAGEEEASGEETTEAGEGISAEAAGEETEEADSEESDLEEAGEQIMADLPPEEMSAASEEEESAGDEEIDGGERGETSEEASEEIFEEALEEIPEEAFEEAFEEPADEARMDEERENEAPDAVILPENDSPGERAWPIERRFCATRMTPCDLTRLYSLAEELEMEPSALIARCVEKGRRGFGGLDWQYEEEAMEGECAFLPPTEEVPSVWLGRDRLTVAYDTAFTQHGEAAALIRALRRILEKPTLLIYDKESDWE